MPKTNFKLDEKKLAAASYIISFYNETITLLNNYAQFLNIMLELEGRYKNIPAEEIYTKLQEEERRALIMVIQLIRQSATVVYIQYKVIIDSVEKTKDKDLDKEIEETYIILRDNFVFTRLDIERFTISINKFLVKGIINELLVSSQDIINQIYTTDENAPA